jgi:hypothetical protein
MAFGAGRNAGAMAPKTFAHGWATLAAMDRPGDHLAIGIEWSDERVLGTELEQLLVFGLPADKLPQGATMPGGPLARSSSSQASQGLAWLPRPPDPVGAPTPATAGRPLPKCH